MEILNPSAKISGEASTSPNLIALKAENKPINWPRIPIISAKMPKDFTVFIFLKVCSELFILRNETVIKKTTEMIRIIRTIMVRIPIKIGPPLKNNSVISLSLNYGRSSYAMFCFPNIASFVNLKEWRSPYSFRFFIGAQFFWFSH